MTVSARKLLGIGHVAAAAGLAFTFVVQIVDLHLGGSLVPDEYVVDFTNDTTMIAIVLLALTGVSMLTRERDGILLTSAALAVVPLAMVTGVVYNLTLRGAPTDAYLGMPWENEVLLVALYLGGISVFVVLVTALGILVSRFRAAPFSSGSAGTR